MKLRRLIISNEYTAWVRESQYPPFGGLQHEVVEAPPEVAKLFTPDPGERELWSVWVDSEGNITTYKQQSREVS